MFVRFLFLFRFRRLHYKSRVLPWHRKFGVPGTLSPEILRCPKKFWCPHPENPIFKAKF